MNNRHGRNTVASTYSAGRGRCLGFTLIELMVAMAVFLIIGGATFGLFNQHAKLFNDQQYQVGLNISMRNALSQLESDMVNAGTGYYLTVTRATWPIGVIIKNSAPGGGCYNAATFTYQASCFDTLRILTTDSTTPPGAPGFDATGAGCTNTNTSANAYVTPPSVINPATNANWTVADYAKQFKNGDQVLFAGTSGNYNTAKLTADGTASGGTVQLVHMQTSTAGQANTGPPNGTDPLDFSTHNDANLAISFCQATDWVVKLASPIVYTVDATDPTNPQLTRAQGGATAVVAEQIIGFKVGASTFVGATGSSTALYNYDSSSYGYDYNSIRSVRASLIGRTPPNLANQYRNSFDQGPYKIEAMSVVVNPRNLSMND